MQLHVLKSNTFCWLSELYVVKKDVLITVNMTLKICTSGLRINPLSETDIEV